ncbi:hypothetical protein GQ53DRAFT_754265 [Thozetella sp. PMI_491]|nr:hypothetical protein GQ53DRAFT_754265 [Thozetella sp. PMI_491]
MRNCRYRSLSTARLFHETFLLVTVYLVAQRLGRTIAVPDASHGRNVVRTNDTMRGGALPATRNLAPRHKLASTSARSACRSLGQLRRRQSGRSLGR